MISETAILAVELKLQDQLTGGVAAAESKLGMLETTAGRTASGSLTRLQTVTNGVGTALGHAKSQLSGLIGGFGLLAGGAGLFSVFGGLEQGVSKIETMGLAVEKLTGVTGLSVHSASQLVAVFQKFGVDAGAATTSAAFAEKTIGKLAETMTGKGAAAVSKLTALDKQYGVNLVDAKGKAVDYATELGVVADYYNSNATTASKAALAAQLLGRGYVALIPILKLGSAGIAEAAEEADKLGVTLKTAQDVQNVQKFIAAQRDAQEALGGLEEQLGLLVMPDLTTGLKAFRDFVVNNGPEIQGGFRSLLGFAEQIGGAFTNVVIPAIQEIGGVWNSLPGPIKELLIGGFLANKAVKWTFGIDIAGLATKALGGAVAGLIGNIFKNATTGVMSVEAGVVNVGGVGAALPAAENAAIPAAETAAGVTGAEVVSGGLLSTIAGVVIPAAAVFALAYFADDIQKTLGDNYTPASTLPADQLSWPWGPKNTPHLDIGPFKNILGGDSSFTTPPAGPNSSGGTGGYVGQDQYQPVLKATVDTGSAGVMARAIANGLHPTVTGIAATLAKDATTRAIEAAVDRTTHAIQVKQFVATGILGSPSLTGNTPMLHVTTTVSNRQNETASAYSNRYGPTPVHAGAQ